jgi:hypothetical protein
MVPAWPPVATSSRSGCGSSCSLQHALEILVRAAAAHGQHIAAAGEAQPLHDAGIGRLAQDVLAALADDLEPALPRAAWAEVPLQLVGTEARDGGDHAAPAHERGEQHAVPAAKGEGVVARVGGAGGVVDDDHLLRAQRRRGIAQVDERALAGGARQVDLLPGMAAAAAHGLRGPWAIGARGFGACRYECRRRWRSLGAGGTHQLDREPIHARGLPCEEAAVEHQAEIVRHGRSAT